MRKLTLFMHVSLDGFVADANSDMRWVKVDEQMFEHADRQTDQSDLALYGRKTFEMMDAYWPNAAEEPNASSHDIHHSNWYNAVNKVVLSKTMQTNDQKTTVISDDVPDRVRELKRKDGKGIVMFGSPTAAHALMSADLIDEYRLFINPILIGSGIRLFDGIDTRAQLNLVSAETFPSGVVALHYTRAEK